ncbi:alpha/beta fold hydrolase [Phenylobacterium sp. LH3H17]|uniref:acyl-CoA thioester hydrolase/BAAT C-terminal domain-containing protein n=1 Tax=Phenylobacterium sp. LH3H17 TaxID=2903901 RepID=UPI0020C9D6C5|nr:acyl-CoA thioester hydrolase/BAAT C-terminal domain-containing protein [Phenylobacterium sp. LH3H17]UTP40903.1 alpha/beta fold hydrolase [Phenylobacterium sp. LH3H17]
MTSTEHLPSGDVQGALIRPDTSNGLGVMVLTGSSGRVDAERAKRFASLGATSLALRWWGGEDQPPGINLVPLETFVRGVDLLQAEGCDRIAILGTSFGATAALLAAARDPRVDHVIAISPSAVVWQNNGPGQDGSAWPPRSSFTWGGSPLPFVVWDPRVWPPFGTQNPVFRPMYELSLRTFEEDVPAASIPVEQIQAEIILVAGKADALWPSDTAARRIIERLEQHGRSATLVEHPDAGHSPAFPGETQLAAPAERAWGGAPAADRELGAVAWDVIVRRLQSDDRLSV